jgi:hypothetical protein
VFTARYALSPYIKQIRFVFKGLINILLVAIIIIIIIIIITEEKRRKDWMALKQRFLRSYVNSQLPKNNPGARPWSAAHRLVTTGLEGITVTLNDTCRPRVLFFRRCWYMMTPMMYFFSIGSMQWTLCYPWRQQIRYALYLCKSNFRNSSRDFPHSSIPWLVQPPAVAFPAQSS